MYLLQRNLASDLHYSHFNFLNPSQISTKEKSWTQSAIHLSSTEKTHENFYITRENSSFQLHYHKPKRSRTLLIKPNIPSIDQMFNFLITLPLR